MINRRLILGSAACALLSLACCRAFADSWKTTYPELVFGVVPIESASGTAERFIPLTEYLTGQLGVPVRLKLTTDYASVIEGQRSGQIHIAYHDAGSYARAYMTGVKIEPFAVEVNADGSHSHHSVFHVKRESPFEKIADLRGKTLALVDPDSMAGNVVPRFALHGMGIDADTFFGKVIYTGNHENAILALKDGSADVCANWWSHEGDSMLRRMDDRGVPGIRYNDYRIIYVSGQIVNSPIAYLSNLPGDLKKAIREAFFTIEMNNKAAFDAFAGGKLLPWEPVSQKEYEPAIELINFVDGFRRGNRNHPG
ncbi:MAG: phosphonate ABC transporter substrate-binding protein [Rhodomicrobium sp.]